MGRRTPPYVLTLLGLTFGLPDWTLATSPFWHTPHVANRSVDLGGLISIFLFMLGFLIIGFIGFRRNRAR